MLKGRASEGGGGGRTHLLSYRSSIYTDQKSHPLYRSTPLCQGELRYKLHPSCLGKQIASNHQLCWPTSALLVRRLITLFKITNTIQLYVLYIYLMNDDELAGAHSANFVDRPIISGHARLGRVLIGQACFARFAVFSSTKQCGIIPATLTGLRSMSRQSQGQPTSSSQLADIIAYVIPTRAMKNGAWVAYATMYAGIVY